MRKLYCFIALLFLSASVLAQNKAEDTTRHMMIVDAKSISKYDKSLYVIDGVVFKGNIKKIDTAGIVNIAVLKGPDAVNIYGPKAANGVVLINTTRAKRPSALKKADTISTSLPDSAIYIVDGTITNKKLNGINPHDIFTITFLKEDKASQYFESGTRFGVVVIETKTGATKNYQEKLSSFSKKYKNYIETHQNSDNDLVYIIDGVLLEKKNNDEMMRTLYGISIENIKTVNYSDNFLQGMKSEATIFITTKNKNHKNK